MVLLRLAFRNIWGAGLRTWLNAIVLSISFVAIIWTQGLYEGMAEQVSREMIKVSVGGGQIWHSNYDPYDPLTLDESHGQIPPICQQWIANDQAAPVLIHQGAIYPQGRMQQILLKGIDPGQQIVQLPTQGLANHDRLTGLIGARMARKTGLQKGDYITIRWRDSKGVFDAADVQIAGIFDTYAASIDQNQIWLPLNRLQRMLAMPDQATMFILDREFSPSKIPEGWLFKRQNDLLANIQEIVQAKSVGASILYVVLLLLAMLAIFDTQVLSIFRRRKEIGTLIALGMTRSRVIGLFTLEGSMHGVLAAIVAAIYGIPLLVWYAVYGLGLPIDAENYGIALGQRIFPIYSAGLIIGTTLLIMIVVTIISYWPTRRIAKLKPTDALLGKTQ
ncbi:MAG: FtsX-like permease family protein [Caldithrix sp.]|nr:FtsX-like permease family protein [Caldithrix sp.]